jgi:hypothetical protein
MFAVTVAVVAVGLVVPLHNGEVLGHWGQQQEERCC